METPALRAICAVLLLSFWYAVLLLLSALGLPDSKAFAALMLCLPLFAGLIGSNVAYRFIVGLRWCEVLAALPFTPLVTTLIITFVKIVFLLKSRDLGDIDDFCFIYCIWASLGAFLLPLLDNNLRRQEPGIALHRASFGVLGLALTGLVGLGLLQNPARQGGQWGEAFLVIAVFPTLFVTALGWLLSVVSGKTARTGAAIAAGGTLAVFAMAAYWAAAGQYFPK